MTTIAIGILGALVFWLTARLWYISQALDKALDLAERNGEQANRAAALAQRAIRQRDQAQTGVIQGDYFVDPELRELYGPVLDHINSMPPPPSPDHYSVGGTQPHMCVCGKPLNDHR